MKISLLKETSNVLPYHSFILEYDYYLIGIGDPTPLS